MKRPHKTHMTTPPVASNATTPVSWHGSAITQEYAKIASIVAGKWSGTPGDASNHEHTYFLLARCMGTLSMLLIAQHEALNAPRKRKPYTRKTPPVSVVQKVIERKAVKKFVNDHAKHLTKNPKHR